MPLALGRKETLVKAAFVRHGCSWYCCNAELLSIAVVYFAVGSNLYDQGPNIDGEIYVALDPDMTCSE